MIKTFLTERRSWILFILFLQSIMLFIAYIDPTISFSSVVYIFFLSIVALFLFLFFRYQRETRFYRKLREAKEGIDLATDYEGESPFEKIAEESLLYQRDRLLQEITDIRTGLEEEKDELMAWVHEVKTPLTAMRLVIDRIENDEMKSRLTFEWLRIHLLLDQQLHYKRIRFIENDLYMEQIDFQPIIYKEIRDLQSWCIHKGIGFSIDLKEKGVTTDGKWLAFIIRQLLTNAVKYSKDSDIDIKSFKRDGKTVLEIKDKGRGIKEKDLPRIFEKGFTSTENQRGNTATGMGLYLAKKVADPLKIEISVQSIYGKGTTVSLIFPKRNDVVSVTGV